MIIAVDTTGGEHAPHEVVKGAIKAAEEYGVEIALVGRRSTLHVLASRYSKKLDFTIVNASQVIEPNESPIRAVSNNPDSSTVVGINLIKNGAASAFVSVSNAGAALYAALLNLGKIEGIERPAIGSIINLAASPVLLIDAGANADCRPSHLVQFAQMGAIYAKHVLGISSPRVGLLSNGEEETKGNHLVKESHKLLKKTNLNFIGNIEGHDILRGVADVIVTDGFTGNIVLKTIEGLGSTFQYLVQQVGQLFSVASRLPSRALHRDINMDSRIKRWDYQEHGGACLLGVNGNIIIAHGRSQSKAIKNAIGLAKQTVEQNILQIIRGESYE